METAAAIATLLVSGFALFAIAKWSVIGTGVLLSLGPGRMTRSMRRLYFCGYAVMACGAALAVLLLSLVRAGSW